MGEVLLQIFGGLGEIGGNKILFVDRGFKKSIMFDFGKNFNVARKFYEFPFTTPENVFELIEIGSIPPIYNLYTRADPRNPKFDNEPEPPIDAVFVSHAHLDHIGHVTLLNRRIPVYLGECAKRIVLSYQKIVYYRRRLESFWENLEFKTFRSGKEIELGDLVVKPIHVDHSIPGAYGFIIYSSIGTIVYTGDFRRHGPQRGMTEEFARILEKEDVKLLIVEGTKIDFSEYLRESDVRNLLIDVVEKSKSLIYGDFSRTDYDRFSTFFDVASQTGRYLVVNLKTYKIIRDISMCPGIRRRIDLLSDNILLLKEDKKRFTEGELEVLNSVDDEKIVDVDNLSRLGDEYIAIVSLYSPADLKRLKPAKGSIYILSSSEPVDEEREISFERIVNWMELFGVAPIHIHASGHITPIDLKDFVERIDPEIIMPIHTTRPNLVKNFIGDKYKWILGSHGEKIFLH